MPNFTNNAYQDALIEGYRLGNTTIEYYLADTAAGNFTQIERTAFAQATALWNEVANINFAETAVQADAEFIESLYVSGADGTSGNLGVHQNFIGSNTTVVDTITIDGTFATALSGSYNRSGFGWDETNANGGLQRGGIGFATIVHELGHGLGLDHTHITGSNDPHFFPGAPGEYDAGNNGLNSELYSIMSYRSGPEIRPNFIGETQNYGTVGGPMAFDIATVQFLYGANMTTRTGDDVYTMPSANAPGTYWSAIWDAGGTDTISHAGGTAAVTIDLRAATLQDEVGGGGFISRVGTIYGGYTIANGVVIENATGGQAADTLVGNAAANALDGGAGADTMTGGAGDDYYVVENVGDTVTELAGEGSDIIDTFVSYDVPVNVEVLRMQGTADLGTNGSVNRDIIQGNSGNNYINGAGGLDLMVGGSGNDTYTIDDSQDAVIEAAGGGDDVIYTSVDYVLLGDQEIETAILTENAVILRGDNSDNQLIGNDFINVLEGKGGTDYLLGLGGDDIFQVSLEANATDLDVFGDFEGAGVIGGDRIALDAAIWGMDGIVYQVSQTSFIVATAQNTMQQQFQIANITAPTTNLIAGDDYYFG
ncbi:M10 family metallopeptidase C-terminal domain-containing protein [Ahrensia sp. R2A130]|uniref:M10 family metallopeptidase C-terminal domain-containing protein n=1 Tax=Ahrensia sp. R2A130 TaxID=744979 RepID=UPI0001E08455|nr:M10 family metallopeptidase C-terminal domain-containing protein [Ahrensia sp. R2A130]EFL87450.1 secreted protease C [Ahrensia sp. R2A130]